MNEFRSTRYMLYQRLFKWIFLLSLLLLAITYYFKDILPEPSSYDMSILNDPIQTATARDPFPIIANKQHYLLTPKYDYELTGVVVTYNDASGFSNIWHYDVWKDFINVRDLCVIWGPNVSSGVYKNIQFTSDSWTCWASWQDSKTNAIFKGTALSNNHILTDSKRIKERLLQAEKGDVVHFRGVLTEYKNEDTGGTRGTSVTRNDSGNGACETVYVDEFDIVKKANPIWRNFYSLAKWMAIFSLGGYLIMVSVTPFRPRR